MRRILTFSMIAVWAMVLIFVPAARAEMYTWTNADGSLGVTDDPNKVPEKYRGQIKKAGEGEDGSDRISYSNPQQEPTETRPLSSRQKDQPKQEPIVTMEEQRKIDEQAAEKRKKDEEEIKKTWNNMKKALAGQ